MAKISEGNEIVAKFMGLAFCTRHNYEGWYTNREFNRRICDYNGLKYHSSWDDLMPVVSRVESICQDEEFCKNYFDKGSYIVSMFGDLFVSSDINGVYKEIVSFITWYNENKKE